MTSTARTGGSLRLHLRAFRALFISLLSGSLLLVFVAPGGAATASKSRSSNACDTFEVLQDDMEQTGSFDGNEYEQLAAAFRKASKQSPKAVKASLLKLATFYKSLGKYDSRTELTRAYAKNAAKYASAFTTFAKYYAGKCTPTGKVAKPGTSARSSKSKDSGSTSPVVVAVDGDEYPVTTIQECESTGDPKRNVDFALYGYAESGERVELTFSHQPADESPSGEEMFYGSFGLSSGSGGHWQSESSEPWPFLSGGRSSVSGSVEMEDTSGESVEISFDITCD